MTIVTFIPYHAEGYLQLLPNYAKHDYSRDWSQVLNYAKCDYCCMMGLWLKNRF